MIRAALAISVAVLIVFCLSVSRLLVGQPGFENNRQLIAGALATCGVAAGLLGLYLAKRRRQEGERRDENDEVNEEPFVIFDLRYWGPMLVVLGGITLFIHAKATQTKPDLTKAAPTATIPAANSGAIPATNKIEAVVPAPVVETPKPAPPVVFPPLKIQGVTIIPGHSTVIINGASYAVGEQVGDVKVTEITRSHITVERMGTSKVISLQ